jgi:hypothetical protein
MIEGSNHVDENGSDAELEATAVAGAVAVQKLIVDRNSLRDQLAASQCAQEELRRRLGMLHQRYIGLAKTVVSNLQHFDHTMREAMEEKPNGAEPQRQFDNNGLPVEPQLNGNGIPNGRAQLEA